MLIDSSCRKHKWSAICTEDLSIPRNCSRLALYVLFTSASMKAWTITDKLSVVRVTSKLYSGMFPKLCLLRLLVDVEVTA